MNRFKIILAAMTVDLGGAETHVVNLAGGLCRRGHQLLVTSRGGCLEDEIRQAGASHVSLPLDSRLPRRLYQSLRGMRELLRRECPSVIHAHARIPAWVCERSRRNLDIPLVTTYHGLYRAGWPWRKVTRWGDHVVAVSGEVRDYLIASLGAPAEAVSVIPNGIDTGRYSPEPSGGDRSPDGEGPPDGETLRNAETPADGGGPVIVHVSRMQGPFAGVALQLPVAAVSLARTYPGLTVYIIGEGDGLPEVRMRAAAANREAGYSAVRVMGGQPHPVSYYRLADVVLGVGRSALEAMACGKPVLLAGKDGILGFVGPENAAQAAYHNFTARGDAGAGAADLTRALTEMLGRPGLMAELGSFGRRLVLDEFSLEAMLDKIEAVYRKVIR